MSNIVSVGVSRRFQNLFESAAQALNLAADVAAEIIEDLRSELQEGEVMPDLELLHAQWVEVAEPDGGELRLRALRKCLQELPARSRRALELRYGEAAERPAIGKELGIGAEGVKSLLERVRAMLAVCMQKRAQEEP